MKSEIKLTNSKFKVKIGTMDKKGVGTMYIELGTYITPTEDIDYSRAIKSIEKGINARIKEYSFLDKNFIFVSETAIDRISPKRRVHLSMELSFKPKTTQSLFKDITNEIIVDYKDECEEIKNLIEHNGFACFKNKI